MAKKKITFRIAPELVEKLKWEAKKDFRKNSEMLRVILEDAERVLALSLPLVEKNEKEVLAVSHPIEKRVENEKSTSMLADSPPHKSGFNESRRNLEKESAWKRDNVGGVLAVSTPLFNKEEIHWLQEMIENKKNTTKEKQKTKTVCISVFLEIDVLERLRSHFEKLKEYGLHISLNEAVNAVLKARYGKYEQNNSTPA